MPAGATTRIENDKQLEVLEIENALATARISLFGGHVLSFVPKSDHRERLWLSPKTFKNAENPIRGGIPVCWPWFSDAHGKAKGELPSHGYVRTQAWRIVDSVEQEDANIVVLAPIYTDHEGFDGQTTLHMVITVGETLRVELITKNVGDAPCSYNCALHTYFQVENVNDITLKGINGKYEDKTAGFRTFTTPEEYRFTQETDRVHQCTAENVTIEEGQSVTQVRSSGHDSLVVWNPWKDNSKAMADMPDDGYLSMICVETAITGDKTLQPGEQHTLTQIIG